MSRLVWRSNIYNCLLVPNTNLSEISKFPLKRSSVRLPVPLVPLAVMARTHRLLCSLTVNLDSSLQPKTSNRFSPWFLEVPLFSATNANRQGINWSKVRYPAASLSPGGLPASHYPGSYRVLSSRRYRTRGGCGGECEIPNCRLDRRYDNDDCWIVSGASISGSLQTLILSVVGTLRSLIICGVRVRGASYYRYSNGVSSSSGRRLTHFDGDICSGFFNG